MSDELKQAALSEIIERLEGAAEGSDELSARVMAALAAPAGSFAERSRYNGAWCVYLSDVDARTGEHRLWERRGWQRPGGWSVTESLDAALALAERVLPGWGWILRVDAERGYLGRVFSADFSAEVEETDVGDRWIVTSGRDASAYAPTPALALCLAICRAKQEASDA